MNNLNNKLMLNQKSFISKEEDYSNDLHEK
jgi:hypothetical protein